jgi:hypothetical protein
MDKLIVVILGIVMAFVIIAGVSLAFALPVKWCWNYTIVYLFSLPAITWGQAWCLTFLAGAFFKSSQINKSS